RYLLTGLPLPAHIFARLETWQAIIELNRPQFINLIRRARTETDRPADIAALETLVTRNYGLEVFPALEAGKIELTDAPASTISFSHPDLEVEKPVLRLDFDTSISGLVREAQACVVAALELAGLAPEAIDYVVTTGGSSLIPAFRSMLLACLP